MVVATVKLHEPRNKGKMASSGHGGPKINGSSSTTDELMLILRQQASSKLISSSPGIGIFCNSFLFFFICNSAFCIFDR